MNIPVVRQCCCGCTLETGSKIIGWLELVLSILTIMGGITGAVSDESKRITYVFLALSGVLGIGISVLLLIGVNRKLPSYLHVWVILSIFGTLLYIVSMAAEVIIIFASGLISAGFIALIIGLIFTLLYTYFIIIVHSFRKEVLGLNNQQA